jgi:hypothetical protein
MIRASVSNLDKYAAYLNDDEYPLELLLRELRGQTPRTPAMERGGAFAKAMENLTLESGKATRHQALKGLPDNCSDLLIAEGHAFAFTCNAEIEAWPRRELKAEKDYGGITVSARCDRLHGNIIEDDKTTASFSQGGVEKYIDKWQHRYYMDIFGANRFNYYIWEVREIDVEKHGSRKDYPGVNYAWEVYALHKFSLYRHPELESECRDFALQFKDFAERSGL